MHFKSTKWRSYEIPSVRLAFLLFVRSFSLEPHVEIFLFLEVKMLSNLKNDGVEVFEKKILFWVFLNQKDTWGFSSFIKNWPMEFFWFFAWSYSNKKVLKLNKITFWGKILSWCFPAKRGQNDPKIRFFKFYKKLILRIFLIFCIKLQ